MSTCRSISRPGCGKVATTLLLLLITLSAVSVGAEEMPTPAGSLHEVEEAISRWDIPRARAALESIPSDGNPTVLWYRGLAAFFAGEYADARDWFGRIPKRTHGTAKLRRMKRLTSDSLDVALALVPYESEHFSLYLDPRRDGVLAAAALAALEAAREKAGDWIGWRPAGKVRVEIVPDAGSFERISGLSREEIERSGAVGICKFNKIMILSPRVLVQGYRWRDALAHEFIHYLLVRISAGRAPVWLQEGTARYGDTLWRSGESLWMGRVEEGLLAGALREGELLPFAVMSDSLVRLPSMKMVRLAFAQCAHAVEYLLEKWGTKGLRGLLEGLAEERPPSGQSVLEGVLGVDLATFEEGLRASLRERGLREAEGLVTPGFMVSSGGEGDAEEWDLDRWQPLEARRYIRLGDMLRSRQRRRGALKEYRKALDIAPLSPYVLNRMGRILLEMEREQEAEEMFVMAMEAAPDYPATYSGLAEVLALTGRWEESREALEAYLEINPFNPVVWKDLGSVHMQLGEKETAVRYWETSFRLNPGDEELRRVLGRP
jgi:hypothetical protein